MKNPEYPYVYMHNSPGGCGKPCFYINYKPKKGDLVSIDNCLDLDGTKPTDHSVIECGSCGGSILGSPLPEDVIERENKT